MGRGWDSKEIRGNEADEALIENSIYGFWYKEVHEMKHLEEL